MSRKIISCLIVLVSGSFGTILYAQNLKNNPTSNHGDKFEQLGSIRADPSEYRNAAGAPGHKYWQQKADYKINAKLDEENRTLFGEEVITYTNNSPDPLSYLWLQLDENQHDPNAESNFFNEENLGNNPFKTDQTIQAEKLEVLDIENRLKGYGVKIQHVLDKKGNKLTYTINYTMMRVDLPKALKSGESFTFQVKWRYKIPERMKIGGRGGYEYFEEDGNDLFTISQWYPRMCVYSDYQGWNHKQFTGRGEFALVFGDFEVNMDVPADHIIAATGECQNYKQVLSKSEYERWLEARESNTPVHDERYSNL